MSGTPLVSVVVAARNEARRLPLLLKALQTQSYSAWELIVVDDHSTDTTYETARQQLAARPNARLLRNAYTPGKKQALRTGIEAARGNIILLTDADCMPASRDWIRCMAAPFKEEQTTIVVGVSRLMGKGWSGILQQYDHYWEVRQARWLSRLHMPYWAVGRNWACRRHHWLSLRQKPAFWKVPWGDDDLAIRFLATPSGYRWQPDRRACVQTPAAPTFRRWFRQKHRHLRGGRHYRRRVWLTLAGLNIVTTGLVWSIPWLPWPLALTMAVLLPGLGMLSHRQARRWGMHPGPPAAWMLTMVAYHAVVFPMLYLITGLTLHRRQW